MLAIVSPGFIHVDGDSELLSVQSFLVSIYTTSEVGLWIESTTWESGCHIYHASNDSFVFHVGLFEGSDIGVCKCLQMIC